MAFIIWGVSTVMTVNLKVAQATHETPFSAVRGEAGNSGSMLPARRTIPACKPESPLQEKRGTVMTFMIWGISTVMTVGRQ
jgi:hypothetical protein